MDRKTQTVVLPVHGFAVPFHINTIKNASKSDEGDFTYLRINFQTPGQLAGKKEDTVSVWLAVKMRSILNLMLHISHLKILMRLSFVRCPIALLTATASTTLSSKSMSSRKKPTNENSKRKKWPMSLNRLTLLRSKAGALLRCLKRSFDQHLTASVFLERLRSTRMVSGTFLWGLTKSVSTA